MQLQSAVVLPLSVTKSGKGICKPNTRDNALLTSALVVAALAYPKLITAKSFHHEKSAAARKHRDQGDVLFGGDLSGGRDRALTFPWHLVPDKTAPVSAFPRIFQEWWSSPRPFHCRCLLDILQTILFLPNGVPSTFDSKCICPTLSNADYMNWLRGKGQEDRRGGSAAKGAAVAARIVLRQPHVTSKAQIQLWPVAVKDVCSDHEPVGWRAGGEGGG